MNLKQRFRSFLPVVIDVETSGFDPQKNALLEIGAVFLNFERDQLKPIQSFNIHIKPFPGAELDPKAMAFHGIDPDHPFRQAVDEKTALLDLFRPIRKMIKQENCHRAILVGHNAAFDLNFINAAVARHGIKRNPFHPFSTLDTVSLSALAYGQTVLAKAVICAGMEWNAQSAHSALYDAQKTAQLFCSIFNQYPWPS